MKSTQLKVGACIRKLTSDTDVETFGPRLLDAPLLAASISTVALFMREGCSDDAAVPVHLNRVQHKAKEP